ncbi:FkbM family methyltransferase [Roseomonas sp. NAR14]|uniref:FkbM family methyltransferase n=1 Tax=Roseomonas acroporae TaxID=2937791 RepID=A0A9X1Y3T3_9PROT|nr:FkbM family methyltransferase [Roseomonas acroporae]MCK8782928.1 FkbM family methyltransferase [Roseomonas acroporae]
MPETSRLPRVAVIVLSGLDHFAGDLPVALEETGRLEARSFRSHAGMGSAHAAVAAALAWADDPARDSVWFEFCWPTFFPAIRDTDFAGRRTVVRIHRIEAQDTNHVADAPWEKLTDAVVVSDAMREALLRRVPGIGATTAVHVVRNGLDLDRFRPSTTPPDPFRIGWCGSMILRKNPILALEILHGLRRIEPRWHLHLAVKGGDPFVADLLCDLVPKFGLAGAVRYDGELLPEEMPAWHAANRVLLSTSLHESFGYAIAEAAACGCDLAVFDHPGAAEAWPEAVRFVQAERAIDLILNAAPGRWREHVAIHCSLAAQAGAAAAVLLAPRPAIAGAPAVRRDAPAARADVPVVPLAHGAWRGRFVLRDGNDHIQRCVAASGGFYEAEMLEDLRGRLPSGGSFVDVGANVGNHALFAAGVCGARVLAFEPSAALAAHCRENLAENGLAGRAEVLRNGVGDRAGQARLVHGPAGNAGMTRLDDMIETGAEAGADAAAETVGVVRLDEVLAERGLVPDVIKVDVEGMEAAVLRGAEETLRRHSPTLYVEAADTAAFARVEAVLRPLGYRARTRFNATPTFLYLREPPVGAPGAAGADGARAA